MRMAHFLLRLIVIVTCAGHATATANIGQAEFEICQPSVRLIGSDDTHTIEAFIVDPQYDFTKTTEEVYSTEDCEFVGKYAHLREKMDYSYHKCYTPARQLAHDEVIDEFIKTLVVDTETQMLCVRPQAPWCIFTAGPMGAGKSHSMHWMEARGYFPLSSFIQVDPDRIRYLLPEWNGYIETDREAAGSRTHKEAGFIAEVLTMYGLREGRNVIVDGSLRDGEWHKKYFTKIRSSFPAFRLAIIYCEASEAHLLKRVRNRSARSGRVVPEDILRQTMTEVPKTVEALKDYVNYTARITTNKDYPELVGNESWTSFTQRWKQDCYGGEMVEPEQDGSCIDFDAQRVCLVHVPSRC